MSEINLETLEPRLRKQVQNADRAIASGNANYAIPVCMGILKQHPEALPVRRVLRKAQMHSAGPAKAKASGMTKFFSKVTQAPFMMLGGQMAKKDPDKAMIQAETALSTNPRNSSAHQLLGKAAEEKELWDTAVFAYETLREVEPGNLENLKALGNAYVLNGQNKEAIVLCEKILRENSGDPEAQDIIKRASVAQTVDKGSWEGEGNFRDRLKDTDEAEDLEKASASMTGEESLQQLIDKEKERIEAEPDNINAYKQIVNLYRRRKMPEAALEWIMKARELEQGKTDVTLERIENLLRVEVMREKIESLEAALESSPDDAEKQKALDAAKSEERQYRLEQARNMVERYPNELQYRFELGELLFEDGEIDESIKQFQAAQRNAKVRIQSLFYLGKAFKEKRIYDLAIEQFETAREEIPGMSDQKKGVLYELAECLEAKGDKDRAIAEYKKIYAADIGYRDVSEKIDQFYSQQS